MVRLKMEKTSSGWWCVLTILKNDGVRQWGRIIPYIVENKKCLKPPTSHLMAILKMVFKEI